MDNAAPKPLLIVTGASGMLGKALIKMASGRFRVLGVSRRATPGGVSCDLSDPAQVQKLFKDHPASLVIHCAAYSDVDGCERDPKQAESSNVRAPKNLSEECSAGRIPWIYVSTDYVFDGRKRTLYVETDVAGPVNVYGLTKWCGEFYSLNGAVSSAIVRTSWLFGPDNPANFVNAILERLQKEKKVFVLDDQTDSPTSVKDLSAALLNIGEHLMARHTKDPGGAWHDIFHICNAGAATRLEMTQRMKEWLNLKDVQVERLDRALMKNRPALRPPYVPMSTRHYEELFKVKLRPWQESLREYLDETVPCAS